MFHGWFSMVERCRACKFRFEREQGYFVGAIHLNSAATGLIVIPGCLVLAITGVPVTYQLVIAAALCVLVPLLFFRYSKSLWLAMDYFFDPDGTPEAGSRPDRAGERLLSPAEQSARIPHDEPIRVECYAGSRADATPRRLWTDDRWEELTVLEGWVSESAEGGTRIRWFRVRLKRGTERLICHDEELDLWFWRVPQPGKNSRAR